MPSGPKKDHIMTTTKLFTESCVHGMPPLCTQACPLNIDIKKFLKKIRAGNFSSAYREYCSKSIFPSIVNQLCTMPCMENCPSEISMRLLEQVCIERTEDHSPILYNLPKKDKKIAIIGSGISGLACMYRLSEKGYSVTVFEKGDEIGGNLYQFLPETLYLPELHQQLSKNQYSLMLQHNVHNLDEIETSRFHAVYIATGTSGNHFSLLKNYNPETLETEKAGFFIGGSITGCSKIESLAQGIKAAGSIESWLKTGHVELKKTDCKNKFFPRSKQLKANETIPRLNAIWPHYDDKIAIAEAKRCLNCDCTVCYDSCEFMQEQKLMPRELEVKVKNIRGLVTRVSNKTIASCALCGHCTSVCDFNVSTELLMREGKRLLFEDGGFPKAYHDFYMRDLEEAMSSAFLYRSAPGHTSAKYIFFPGCQAAASNPEYVTIPYQYILKHNEDTAILLSCCGVPALYAGDMKRMREVHMKILEIFNSLSNPTVILSCPTCAKTFKEFFPHIQCISIYEYIWRNTIPERARSLSHVAALFDPCSSRQFPDMQNCVRGLLRAVGQSYVELPENRKHAICCGQGGHIYAANPKLSEKFTERAINLSDFPYITYCTNCRDRFLSYGKPTVYALDLLFGINAHRSPPHLFDRKVNRYEAIRILLKTIWKETLPLQKNMEFPYTLRISEKTKHKMDQLLISEYEIREAILFCENENKYFENSKSGLRVGSMLNGACTIWIEYQINQKDIILYNAYCHRMAFTLAAD
ncbi:pyridine nucleotide-disulfide oxidoreductase/dicluster-binding protein [Zhenpiania hominis]|uniref:pyridine nucleotide-disulfide oxidoreductase/dicluster-binding protein n=1 Tax=Zhenpiania hominis TaxID=2763644 RepID=UPI0039F53C6C